ncbi:MAG TPA: SDR family oxidoreductase, partial [Anaeromyxobacteraceae bacterium]|nr:SDR family oxidoreductase [Anaeromyxobacteraceae bacterium]
MTGCRAREEQEGKGPVLVTGGSSGIGAAVVRLAAARGRPVAFSYRTGKAAAEALVAELSAKGAEVHAVAADVAKEADLVRLFDEVDRRFAGRPLSGLVNSAGIGGRQGPVSTFTGESLAELWATNVTGTILASREAVRRLAARPGGGAIVNVSSMAATIGGRPGASAYAASKAAVDVFTVGLAKAVAPRGIRVNVVRPGFTQTPMTRRASEDPSALAAVAATIPIGRIATAEEVAAPIVWLLSDEASFVTGARLDVSGGGFLVGGLPL